VKQRAFAIGLTVRTKGTASIFLQCWNIEMGIISTNVTKYCSTYQFRNMVQIVFSLQGTGIATSFTETFVKWNVIIVKNMWNAPMINKLIRYTFNGINRYTEYADMFNNLILNLYVCLLCLN